MPRTADGAAGCRRWSGMRGPKERIPSGGVSMMRRSDGSSKIDYVLTGGWCCIRIPRTIREPAVV